MRSNAGMANRQQAPPPPVNTVAWLISINLLVFQSKCLRLVTGAPWYVRYRQTNEDMGVLLFTDHIRALTASFDSKLADERNPLVLQLGRYLR